MTDGNDLLMGEHHDPPTEEDIELDGHASQNMVFTKADVPGGYAMSGNQSVLVTPEGEVQLPKREMFLDAIPTPELDVSVQPSFHVADVDLEPVDMINHPPHYTSNPSGVECIDVVEHMSFNTGSAIKYLWRADLKGDPLADLQKAKWFIEREILRRSKA